MQLEEETFDLDCFVFVCVTHFFCRSVQLKMLLLSSVNICLLSLSIKQQQIVWQCDFWGLKLVGSLLTRNCLCGRWFALAQTLLSNQQDVIQTPRLQLPNVSRVLADCYCHYLTPPFSVVGADGQTVPVNLPL